jgi:hypothetical protein
MKMLALAVATTAILGFAAPAFAAESNTTGQAQAQTQPAAQGNVKKANVSAKATHKAKMVQHRPNVNKFAQHDRGLHRGFTRGHYYGYVKSHHKAMPNKTTPNKTTAQ